MESSGEKPLPQHLIYKNAGAEKTFYYRCTFRLKYECDGMEP